MFILFCSCLSRHNDLPDEDVGGASGSDHHQPPFDRFDTFQSGASGLKEEQIP